MRPVLTKSNGVGYVGSKSNQFWILVERDYEEFHRGTFTAARGKVGTILGKGLFTFPELNTLILTN